MTKAKVQPPTLGDEFWVQPEQVIKDEAIQLIYSNIVAMMKAECEARGGSVLDMMLAERTAALYGNIRQRETTNAFANDRNRKETLQLWVQLATTVKKQWMVEDESKIAAQVTEKVTAAMSKALEAVPVEWRVDVNEALQQCLAEAGL